jgi:hypothetical protein
VLDTEKEEAGEGKEEEKAEEFFEGCGDSGVRNEDLPEKTPGSSFGPRPRIIEIILKKAPQAFHIAGAHDFRLRP